VRLNEVKERERKRERGRERMSERTKGSTCVCVVLASFNNRKKGDLSLSMQHSNVVEYFKLKQVIFIS
jgi:hypothetical protein